MRENIRVLAVTGNEALRTLSTAPGAESLEVIDACNCAEARARLREESTLDVVVSDLTLADGNWWSIFKALAAQDRPTPMVVVVPRQGVDVSGILARGVVAVLGCPVTSAELVQAVKQAARNTAAATPSVRATSAAARHRLPMSLQCIA